MDIYIVYRINKEGDTYYEISEDSKYSKKDPEEMPVYIADIIRKARKSTFVYIRGLTQLKDAVISAMYMAGVNFVEGNPNTKDMKALDCKTLIGGDTPKVYHLTVVNHGKKIQFMDLDNLLPDCEKVLKSWGRHEELAYVKAYERGMHDLHTICKVSRKKPCTVSGSTRGLLRKVMPWFKPMSIHDLYTEEGESVDAFIRATYRGGLCIYKDREYVQHEGKGIWLDVHSMYPWIMITKPLPMYNPSYYKGEPTGQVLRAAEHGKKAIFIHIKANFRLKKNGIPCIRSDDITTEQGWLRSSDFCKISTGETVPSNRLIDIYVTYMDYLDFMDNYDVNKMVFVDYITMDCERPGLFTPFVRPLYAAKRHSDGGYKKMVKIILNSLSGTVAMRDKYENYYVHIKDNGEIEYERTETEASKSLIYLGSYVTSYARHEIIKHIRHSYDRWIYSDTDCIVLKGEELPDDIEIGEGIGKFALEKEFEDLMIYKQKMYGYKTKDGYEFTLAGMRDEDIKQIPAVVYKDEEMMYPDMYIKGTEGYRLRTERDRVRKKLEDEYEAVVVSSPMWDMLEVEEHDERSRRLLKRYDDLSAQILIYKHGIGKPPLLEAVFKGKLPMTGYKFMDFERYTWKYTMELNDMTTYE